MIAIALAVLAGTLCLHSLADLPGPSALLALTSVTALSLVCKPTRLFGVAGLAFLWAWLQADVRLAQDLPAELEGQDILVQGRVSGLPESRARQTRFLFSAEQRQNGTEWIAFERRLRLSWYGAPPLAAGQFLRLEVRLKRRNGFHNPGGFDYEGWLLQQGVAATGYVRGGSESALPETGRGDPALALRAAVDRRLTAALEGVAAAGLLRALAVGARDGIDRAAWEDLRTTGTGHLIAISGLHIGLVAGLGVLVGRWLWSRSQRLTQWFAAPRAGALCGLVSASLYAALAGFGIPTRRAWIMVAVILLGVLLKRSGNPWQGLALALMLVTLADPFAVASAGFWLSFGAVAIIFIGLETDLQVRSSYMRSLVRLQLRLTAGLVPVTLLFFGQLGWTAPLANLLAVPWTSLVLVPLLFAALLSLYPLPGLAKLLLMGAGWAADVQQAVLAWFAGLPASVQGLPAVPLVVTALAMAGVALLLMPRGLRGRWIGWVLLAPLALWTPAGPPAGVVWFSLLDVGQGLAAVVRTHRHTLVYDAGPRYPGGFDTGDAVVAPYLRAQGIERIDVLMVSHGDNDHRGGAQALDQRVPAYRVLTSVPDRIDWRYATGCRAGQTWVWDEVRFRVLHPLPDRRVRGNDASCVLQVEAADGTRLLVAGDIEAATEADLIERQGDGLASAVLVVPHHGSRTSSTREFVERVAPELALFAVGYRNRWGFPRAEVLARYRRHGAVTLDTADSGAVELQIGGAPARVAVTRHRATARRYWHRPVSVSLGH